MPEKDPGTTGKKTAERISSPEQLTDYLQVANPRIWALLAAVVLLVAGVFIWGSTGWLETLAPATARVTGGTAEIILADTDKGRVQSGMAVRIGGEEYVISEVRKDEYGRDAAYAEVRAADGKYDAQVVLERVHAIRFLFD